MVRSFEGNNKATSEGSGGFLDRLLARKHQKSEQRGTTTPTIVQQMKEDRAAVEQATTDEKSDGMTR